MISSPTARLLNQLAALHRNSLHSYLSYTHPWAGYQDDDAVEVLRQIAHDHQYVVDKIMTQLEATGQDEHLGNFPMDYTGLHDLSIQYLVKRSLRFQKGFVKRLEDLVDELPDEPLPRALAEEALGLAKGHLKNLEETAIDLASS
ncbi:hypothetical protein LOC68_11645 [Blastopirellula sp. JC732]|uniref:Ferritin/DPS protein domain-containing protein n=1 Tax=Blastopirellula sediminis TaxID=2894196 RepID=A0A9X1SGJ2_9BACT|nr:hypothetical protein [Blastopirellula sediminis]MCC9607655.1 hypothetical protein [Blastopirellula sediminis]MCC9629052.1 hypothetical protein [Blastopirellula sediminis]